MRAIRKLIEDKWNWISQKNNILLCITLIAGTYLMAEMCRNLCYGAESEFQIFKDFFFYKACSFLLIAVILLRKVSFRNIIVPIGALTYVGYAIKYLNDNKATYGMDYENLLKSQFVMRLLLLIILLDIICTAKITRMNRKNIIWMGIMITSFMVAHMLNYRFGEGLILPLLALYLTPVDKEKWMHFTDCLALGYYLAYVWIMTNSFLEVPYGNLHYVGVFLNNATAGAFAGGVVISCFYFLMRFTRKGWRFNWKILLCFVAGIYPLAATVLIGARSSELGIVSALLFAFVFLSWHSEPKLRRKRGIIVLAVMGGMLLGGAALMYGLSRLDRNAICDGISNQVIRNKVYYWLSRAQSTMNADSLYGVVPGGTILNMIDRFSSDRVSIAIECLRLCTWFGCDDIGVYTDKVAFMYPHNNYLTWLKAYGWIGGGLMIAWFIGSIVVSIKKINKKDMTVLFTFVWVAYCVGLFLPETMLWKYPVSFILMILQYPLLVEQEKAET